MNDKRSKSNNSNKKFIPSHELLSIGFITLNYIKKQVQLPSPEQYGSISSVQELIVIVDNLESSKKLKGLKH